MDKKKRKKKPPIKTDTAALRRYYENRARLRKYVDDFASGAIDEHTAIPMPVRGESVDPQEYLAHLKKGSDDGFPSARASAAIYCLSQNYPMEQWVKDWLLEHLAEYIWQNPGNENGGHPVDVAENFQIVEEFDSWRDVTVPTVGGKERHLTVVEAAEKVWLERNKKWLERNPGKTIADARPNELSALIKKYYLARKRMSSTDFKDNLINQLRLPATQRRSNNPHHR